MNNRTMFIGTNLYYSQEFVDVVMLAKHDIIDIKKLLKKLLKVKK